MDNLVVAREIFSAGEYDRIRKFSDIRSFVDLGCNAGYFALLAASLGKKDTVGLAIDANPDSVAQAREQIDANDLFGIHTIWGLVGSEAPGHGRFYVNVDPAGSSQFNKAPVGNVTANPWRAIDVPVLSVSAEWTQRFGCLPCDLLKIDIEGSEDAFLRAEGDLLSLVSIIVIEVHKWLVNVEAVDAILRTHGFIRSEVLRDNGEVRVVLYIRESGDYFASNRSA